MLAAARRGGGRRKRGSRACSSGRSRAANEGNGFWKFLRGEREDTRTGRRVPDQLCGLRAKDWVPRLG